MAQPLAAPYSYFADANGAPLAGGLVYTYTAGTTTPQATYSDSTLGTPLANPVVLDSAGRSQIWLNGSYKIVVKDSLGNTIQTMDSITSLAGAPFSDASAIISNSSDSTKKIIISANSLSAGATRTYTGPDKDGTLAMVSDIQYKFQDFRLSLTSGSPVTTADVTGATTIYCTPYRGNAISLFDGVSTWNTRNSAEFSLALGTLTSGKAYDVFCYDNSGVPTLEFLVWTNDTTRATALVYQNGILVKSGATTRRYLGTFYTTSTTQTEDSLLNRYLYNYYNRVIRLLERHESTATWTYSTATLRQANGSASNQVNAVQGVAEDRVSIEVQASATNSGNVNGAVGIGLDSTSANSAQVYGGFVPSSAANILRASYKAIPSAGRHQYVWLEISQASGTTTWAGSTTTNSVPYQSGISGEVMA